MTCSIRGFRPPAYLEPSTERYRGWPMECKHLFVVPGKKTPTGARTGIGSIGAGKSAKEDPGDDQGRTHDANEDQGTEA